MTDKGSFPRKIHSVESHCHVFESVNFETNLKKAQAISKHKDPSKHLKWSALQQQLTAINAKLSILDIVNTAQK